MMRLFLLFLGLNAFLTNAQTAVQMKAFQDYDHCYTGFLSPDGDTLFKPQFESVNYWSKDIKDGGHIWVVRKSGTCGILNSKGEYILEPFYDSIILYDNDRKLNYLKESAFISFKDGKYGLINCIGGELLHCDYKWVECTYRHRLILQLEDGKRGVFDLKSNRYIVKPEFDDISYSVIRTYNDGWDGDVRKNSEYLTYYLTRNEGKVGLVTYDGDVWFDPLYTKYDFRIQNEGCKNAIVWNLVWDGDKVGVLNQDHEVVLPPIYYELDIHFELIDSCGNDAIVTAVTRRGKKYQFHNLITKEASKTYRLMHQVGGQGLVIENSEWAVIDTSGKEVYRAKKIFSPLAKYVEGSTKFLYTEEVSELPGDEQIDFDYTDAKSFGLFDFKLNKKTPVHYTKIESKIENGVIYYWMYTGLEGTKQILIDIYDSNLELINSHKVYSVGFDQWSDYYDYERDEDENIIVFEKEPNLFGALTRRGDVIIEPEFSMIRPIIEGVSGSYIETYIRAYFVYTDSSAAVYSNRGKLLVQPKYEQIHVITDSVVVGIRNGKYDFFNSAYELIMEGCDTLFNYNLYDAKWMRKMSSYYPIGSHNHYETQITVKDNRCYGLIGNSWTLLDSNALSFKYEWYNFRYYVLNTSGEIVFGSKKGQGFSQRMMTYYLFDFGELKLLDLNGNELATIENVKSYRWPEEGRLSVLLNNGKTGLFNVDTKLWMISPIYLDYMSFYNKKKVQLHWVKLYDTVGAKEYWKIINSDEKDVSPIHFDEPIQFWNIKEQVFRSNGFVGYINRWFSIVIPARYDFVRKIDDYFVLWKDEKWGYADLSGNTIEPRFENIGAGYYRNGRIVYEGSLVGIIGHNGEWLVPLCSHSSFGTDYDLGVILQGGSEHLKFPYVSEGVIFADDSTGICRQLNNENIVLKNLVESMNTRFFPRTKEKSSSYSANPINLIQNKCDTRITFVGDKYYSAIRFQSTQNWDELRNGAEKNTEYLNYSIEDGIKELIVFEDLFTGIDYNEIIDEKLMTIFNQRQLFGLSCIDKAGVIQEAKKKFVLTKEGILFKEVAYNKEVLLPYTEVESILAHPEEFL